MRTMIAPLLVASLFAPLLGAQDQSKEPGDRKARVAVVQKEFDDAQQAFFERYQAAKEGEREALIKTAPTGGAFATKLWPLITEQPADEASGDALAWVMQVAERADKDKARALLLQHHLQSAAIGDVCSSLIYEPSKGNVDFIDRVLAATKSDDVRGKAMWAKAKLLGSAARSAETLAAKRMTPEQRKGYEERLGGDSVTWLGSLDVAATNTQREKLFEEIAEKYGAVKQYDRSLADLAKGELFELRNLAIGKVAPDIVGKDVDGVEFKLSDYRGKVVVLDFWGEW